MAFLNLKVCEREINLTRNNQFQNLTLTTTSSNYMFMDKFFGGTMFSLNHLRAFFCC